jgi:hypothetical protein
MIAYAALAVPLIAPAPDLDMALLNSKAIVPPGTSPLYCQKSSPLLTF